MIRETRADWRCYHVALAPARELIAAQCSFTPAGCVPDWVCSFRFYNADDGCDCDCGAYDPDSNKCDKTGQAAELYCGGVPRSQQDLRPRDGAIHRPHDAPDGPADQAAELGDERTDRGSVFLADYRGPGPGRTDAANAHAEQRAAAADAQAHDDQGPDVVAHAKPTTLKPSRRPSNAPTPRPTRKPSASG